MNTKGILIIVVTILIVAGLYWHFILRGVPKETVDGEKVRQEKVKKELALTYMVPIETDVIARLKDMQGVADDEIISYRNGIKKLMDVAPVMKLLFQKQVGADPDARIHAATDDDRELIDRYGHPWCQSDSSDDCVALPKMPKRTSGVVPDGVGCDVAAKTGSPFEAIVRGKSGRLKPVPYAKMWPEELASVATHLRDAADEFAKIPREENLAVHLRDLADAFENSEPYPFYKSDESWNDLMASDSLIFVRIGPDEVGGGISALGDNCECKARYHFNLGLVSKSAGDITRRLKDAALRFEKQYADLIGDPKNYVARDVMVQLPVFIDVIYQNGDDVGGPGGTPVGQTLPNWCGMDGKGECRHGTMIFINKTVKTYGKDIMEKYILPLFAPDVRKYFDEGSVPDGTVYHEMFHNLGPVYSVKKPGSEDTFGRFLVASDGESWVLPIEELKAQTGALLMVTQFYLDAAGKNKNGEMNDEEFAKAEETYRRFVTGEMAWAFRMILRASRSGPEFKSGSPYSRLAAVQVGYFAENGAMGYDEGTKEWSIDFAKMPDAVISLMRRTGELYARSNVNDVRDFFLYYMKGEGEKRLHRNRIVEVAGEMPSALFDYTIKGLD